MFNSENFYKLSGRTNVVSIIMSLVLGTVAAIPLSIGAAYAVRYVPLIFLNVLVVLAYLFLVYLGYSIGAKMGANRNRFTTIVSAMIVAVVALYFAWVSFLIVLLGDPWSSFINLALNPLEVWKLITSVAESGWFSMSGSTVKGTFYAVILACEALAYFAFFFVVAPLDKNAVYCEDCNKWLDDNKSASTLLDNAISSDLEEAKDSGQINNCINKITLAKEYPGVRLEYIQCGEDCPNPLNLVTAKKITTSTDDNGNLVENAAPIFHNLKVKKEQIAEIHTHIESLVEAAQKEAEAVQAAAQAEEAAAQSSETNADETA